MHDDDLAVAMPLTRQQIEAARGPKAAVDAQRPLAVLWEMEPLTSRSADDATAQPENPPMADVLSLFLAGAECAFRCTMCDLWKHTLDTVTPPGALTTQIRRALEWEAQQSESTDVSAAGAPLSPSLANPPQIASNSSPPAAPGARGQRWVKLYNSSNFFDPRCVPPEDWNDIAAAVQTFSRVVVENHPRLIDSRVTEFSKRLSGVLEIAMGLETVCEQSLRLLNKQMTLADFQRTAETLRGAGADLRVFIMLQPPGTAASQAVHWVMQSLQFAQRCGARHCSIIPTRGGSGIMDRLARDGLFSPPTADALEQALAMALQFEFPMVITADLWDWNHMLGHCDRCRAVRKQRLAQMNLSQRVLPPADIDCPCQTVTTRAGAAPPQQHTAKTN